MSRMRFIAALLTVVLAVSGCSSAQEEATDKNTPDINPKAESANIDTSNVTLYYSYNGEQLLAGETRSIDVPVSQKLEEAVIDALISGPSVDRSDLVGLFWDDVSLVGVDNNEDILFVTLSEDFITTDPTTSVLDEGTVADRKKLAIYSIVDTITEMGTYSRVQFYVESEGVSQLITRNEAGFDTSEKALDQLSWDNTWILTPEKTVEEALDAYSQKDWTELYNYTAYTNLDGTIKPDSDDFAAALNTGNVLDTFETMGFNVASDGQSAVVMLNYIIKTRDADFDRTMKPVVLVRENELWKITYSSIVNVLVNVG